MTPPGGGVKTQPPPEGVRGGQPPCAHVCLGWTTSDSAENVWNFFQKSLHKCKMSCHPLEPRLHGRIRIDFSCWHSARIHSAGLWRSDMLTLFACTYILWVHHSLLALARQKWLEKHQAKARRSGLSWWAASWPRARRRWSTSCMILHPLLGKCSSTARIASLPVDPTSPFADYLSISNNYVLFIYILNFSELGLFLCNSNVSISLHSLASFSLPISWLCPGHFFGNRLDQSRSGCYPETAISYVLRLPFL